MSEERDEAAEKQAEQQIEEHLERGWAALEEGDLQAAETAARAVATLDDQSADAQLLLGSIAQAQGDIDGAMERFQQASELDPDWAEPLLRAAELHLTEEGDLDEALHLCEEALDLAEEEEEYLDALLLKAEIEIEADATEEASTTLEELPDDVTFPHPSYHLQAGSLLRQVGKLDLGEHHLRLALDEPTLSSDAMHGLALIAEERGEHGAMVDWFKKVRLADLAAAPPPWALGHERFAEVAEHTLGELPENIHKLLDNVPVVVADYPGVELVDDGLDPRALGFFAGTPYPDHSSVGGATQLQAIHLFQRNIERYAGGADQVEAEIRTTVLHETGHFFGLSDEELAERGLA